jgi:hypothetical protein
MNDEWVANDSFGCFENEPCHRFFAGANIEATDGNRGVKRN